MMSNSRWTTLNLWQFSGTKLPEIWQRRSRVECLVRRRTFRGPRGFHPHLLQQWVSGKEHSPLIWLQNNGLSRNASIQLLWCCAHRDETRRDEPLQTQTQPQLSIQHIVPLREQLQTPRCVSAVQVRVEVAKFATRLCKRRQ